jgi:glycosyltransferase involved in cell wall biosynthesis
MAAGIPIVASDLPVIREIIQNGVDGTLVQPASTEEWVCAITDLTNSIELRFKYASNAIEKLSRKYTWDQRANSVLWHINSSK